MAPPPPDSGRVPRRALLAVIAAVLLVAGAAAVAARGHVLSPPVVAAAVPVALAARLGEELRAHLAFDISLRQGEQGAPVDVHLEGDWVTTVVAARAAEYD